MQRVARAIRNLLWGLLVASSMVFVLFSRPMRIVDFQSLSPGKTSIHVDTKNPCIEFFFKHEVRGVIDSENRADFEIVIRSVIGHYQVEEDGVFKLPCLVPDRITFYVENLKGEAQKVILKDLAANRVLLAGGWVLLALFFIGALYFTVLSSKTSTREQFYNRTILLISTVVSFMVGALALQLFEQRLNPKQPWHLFQPKLEKTFKIFPGVTPGVDDDYVSFKTNSEGIRARERDLAHWGSVLSILCIGASTTECLYLDDAKTWPALLERKLRATTDRDVWVGNAGKSGLGTGKLVQVAQEYIPRMKPKFVVLLTGFNEGIVPDSQPDQPQPTLVQSKNLASKLKTRLKKIVLVRLVQRYLFNRLSYSANDRIMEDNNLWYLKARQELASKKLIERSWDNLDLKAFENNIEKIDQLARRENAILVICTQPALYGEHLNPEEQQLIWMMGNYTVKSKREKMDRINEKIRELGRRLEVPVVDLDRHLPRTTEVFYDDCHFNSNGARLVAETLYEYFSKEFVAGQ